MNLRITARLMKEAALKKGWQVEHIDKDYPSVLMITSPELEEPIIMWSDATELSSAASFLIAENKLVSLRLAEKVNVPTPEFIVYRDDITATEFLDNHKRVIVKPVDANHGDGITTNITTPEGLAKAVAKAQQVSEVILIQKHYSGHDHRILVVGDKVVAAATRRPPQVEGDGILTVKQLVEALNQNPLRGTGHEAALTLINIDEVAEYIGDDQLETVVPAGETMQILGTANLSRGGEAVDVTDELHPELADAAVRLAQKAGLGVCGVDFLVTDCTKPFSESDAVLLELNLGPGLRMHHFPSVGQPRDVATEILNEIVRRRQAK